MMRGGVGDRLSVWMVLDERTDSPLGLACRPRGGVRCYGLRFGDFVFTETVLVPDSFGPPAMALGRMRGYVT